MQYAVLLALLALALPAHAQPANCHGFDSTFIQMSGADFTRNVASWDAELAIIQSVGGDAVILQYSGDSSGHYDQRTPGFYPVSDLLRAAQARSMKVWIGLYYDATWPSDTSAADRLPPPLNNQVGREWLRALASVHKSFAGFYIPQEIEELTWLRSDREPRLKSFLIRASLELHRLVPTAPIMIAPYFGMTKTVPEYVAFLGRILSTRPVDVVAIQDGKGARSTPDATLDQMYSLAVAQLDQLGIGVWADTELFLQIHGPPRDQQPFQAVPADITTLRSAIALELQHLERLTSFTVLNYMHPTRSAATKTLYDAYRLGCTP